MQSHNLQQLLTRSKNTLFQCNQPCHKPRCKVCSHFDTRCSRKFDNNVTISVAKAACDSQNLVYILFCAKCSNAVYVGETSNCLRLRRNNHKHSIKHRLPRNNVLRRKNHKHSIKHNSTGYPVTTCYDVTITNTALNTGYPVTTCYDVTITNTALNTIQQVTP